MGGLCGVLTPGRITGAIPVDYLMREANIVGSSITGEVKIGKQLKGAVIAYGRPDAEGTETAVNDPDAGEIWTLSVGNGVNDFDGSDPYWRDDGSGTYFGFRTGFVGSALAPIPMAPGSGGPSSPTAVWEHRVWLTTGARARAG
ncbi:MAG: hypothetical protein K2Q09_06520 [Phycisphaerales bacterium]|nr:hypothetical protein [Phycisphaerales bacterium]